MKKYRNSLQYRAKMSIFGAISYETAQISGIMAMKIRSWRGYGRKLKTAASEEIWR
jgi:hypothetical protein